MPPNPGDGDPESEVVHLRRLLEKYEEHVRAALAVADKNADSVRNASESIKTMTSDTHRLVEHVLALPAQVLADAGPLVRADPGGVPGQRPDGSSTDQQEQAGGG